MEKILQTTTAYSRSIFCNILYNEKALAGRKKNFGGPYVVQACNTAWVLYRLPTKVTGGISFFFVYFLCHIYACPTRFFGADLCLIC